MSKNKVFRRAAHEKSHGNTAKYYTKMVCREKCQPANRITQLRKGRRDAGEYRPYKFSVTEIVQYRAILCPSLAGALSLHKLYTQ